MKILKQFVPFLILGLILSGGNVLAQSKKEKEVRVKELKKIEQELEMVRHEQQLQVTKDIEKLLKESKKYEKEARYLSQEKLKAIMEDQKRVQEEALKRYHITLGGYGLELEMELDEIEEIEVSALGGYKVFQNRFPTLVTDYYGRTKESTSLTIRKTIEDLTFSTKFKYNVQEGSDSFHFVASGSVEDGTILIKLINPNAKTIHEFEVSPLADVNWSQNFKWDEENARKNTGIWTIEVSAKGATGSYQVSVRAN